MDALITTEIEAALMDDYEPTREWEEESSGSHQGKPLHEEREVTRRHARGLLDVFYDLDQEFRHIELGLVG